MNPFQILHPFASPHVKLLRHAGCALVSTFTLQCVILSGTAELHVYVDARCTVPGPNA